MNQDTKTLLTSKTFWGVVITALAGAFPHFGIPMAEDSALIIADKIALIVGALFAVYGRITAEKTIK